jgi:hypothetical protein
MAVTLNARLAALRWDVIPWSLVLDLDVPDFETENSPMKRVWIILTDISELSFPLNNTRVPNGCWLTSQVNCSVLPNGFNDYEVCCLLPSFNNDDVVQNLPTKKIVIRAKEITGFSSVKSGKAMNRILDINCRTALANDIDFLNAYEGK